MKTCQGLRKHNGKQIKQEHNGYFNCSQQRGSLKREVKCKIVYEELVNNMTNSKDEYEYYTIKCFLQ